MTTQNSFNSQYANASDGFTLAGGTTPRTLTVTGSDITLGSDQIVTNGHTYTLAGATGTIVNIAAAQTLTNKTISGANNTLTVRLANDVTGNLPVTNLNSGTSASSSTFWRGDGTWASASSTFNPMPTTVVTGTTQAAAVNNAYASNNAGLCTITLPATAAVGDEIRVMGFGAGGWALAQNASQLIRYGNTVTTTGTGGSLASTNQYDSVMIKCLMTNTTFTVVSSQGNITVS